MRVVSIRTPRAGRDGVPIAPCHGGGVSIRTPRAGRDAANARRGSHPGGFYPHAPGGARRVALDQTGVGGGVSIRTPRAGRDAGSAIGTADLESFYPHAPGGARLTARAASLTLWRFYPHAPGGARPRHRVCLGHGLAVSIRTPRAGRDARCQCHESRPRRFYPHAPGGARRETPGGSRAGAGCFYPHAPGGARRSGRRRLRRRCKRFYPHAPGGARPQQGGGLTHNGKFLSARPGRGATFVAANEIGLLLAVSIRTPRAGRDVARP